MKICAEVSDLLVQLIDIESAEQDVLLNGSVDLLAQNLLSLYGRTSNQKSHDLILEILDKSDCSLFRAPAHYVNDSDAFHCGVISEVNNSSNFQLSEDEFMELLPINGHFH